MTNRKYYYVFLLLFYSFCSSFKFAFLNETLYIHLEEQLSDRGFQVAWGLLQLLYYTQTYSLKLPNVLVDLDNINGDHIHHKKFSFWRFPEDNDTILWPEHDYWGWQSTWQAPYPIYVDALQNSNEWIPWRSRRNAVFWSGDILNDVRKYYQVCSQEYRRIVDIQSVDWKTLRDLPRDGPFNSIHNYKPIFLDARKKLKYKFSIYLWGLEWSSSLKRIIAAGNALIMPEPNPHESLVSYLLKTHCSDCYITIKTSPNVNSTEFCTNLVTIVRNYSSNRLDSVARGMGIKLVKFVQKYLNLNETLQYMYDKLVSYSNDQHREMNNYDHYIQNEIKMKQYVNYSCQVLRNYHLNPFERPEDDKTRWQYYEWYNNQCQLQFNSTYLLFTAI